VPVELNEEGLETEDSTEGWQRIRSLRFLSCKPQGVVK
jgi:hypothetical protein